MYFCLKSKSQMSKHTNTMTITGNVMMLRCFGLYDDVIGIITDFLVGTKKQNKDKFQESIQQFIVEGGSLGFYKSSIMIRDKQDEIVLWLLNRRIFYQPSDSVLPSKEWISVSLKEWPNLQNTEIFQTILLDKLQRRFEQFVSVFPEIFDKSNLDYSDVNRLDCNVFNGLLWNNGYDRHRQHPMFPTPHNLKHFLLCLRDRKKKCRFYIWELEEMSHPILDKIHDFPDLELQSYKHKCHSQLREYFVKREKILKRRREIQLIQENKKFFVGWSHTYSLNTQIIITKLTNKCLYYKRIKNGVDTNEVRKVVKINEVSGVEFFNDITMHIVRQDYHTRNLIFASDIVCL